jgi:hypothetical protein
MDAQHDEPTNPNQPLHADSSSDDNAVEPRCGLPRFSCDAIPPRTAQIRAYRVNTPEQVLHWKKRDFPHQLDSFVLNFVCKLARVEPQAIKKLDFRVWLYALDSDGYTTPEYADFKRLWRGRSLNAFYYVVSANTTSTVIFDCFLRALIMADVALQEEISLTQIPAGALPLYRFQGGKLVEYVERVCIDPALGKIPAFVSPILDKGLMRYAWLPVDLDTIYREALQAGRTPRARENVTVNGKPSDLVVEFRTWRLALPAKKTGQRAKRVNKQPGRKRAFIRF